MRRRGTALTQGEHDVIILVARGLTNQEIAEQLDTPVSAVRALLYQASNKMRARNRIESALFALRLKYINIDEVYSFDELLEMLMSLGPDTADALAKLLKQKIRHRPILEEVEPVAMGDKRPASILTNRERTVLILVSRGLTNQEIADELVTSISTIRTFLYQACLKLAVSNRAQAVISAVKKGAVDAEELFTLDELVDLLSPLGADTMETMARQMRLRMQQDDLLSDDQEPLCLSRQPN